MSGDEPSTLNQRLPAQRLSVRFEEDWPVITAVLDQSLRVPLIEGRQPTGFGNVSYTKYMEAYAKVYNLMSNSDTEDVRCIYPALSSYFFDLADEMLAPVALVGKTEGHELLLAYLDVYDRYLSGALLLPRLFTTYNRVILKQHRDAWFTANAPEDSNFSPGVGHPGEQPVLEHKPIEITEIPDHIMRYDTGTAAGAPKATNIASLLWPPEGEVVPSGDQAADTREMEQCEARQYSSVTANVYMQLVPTLLRLWRLATVKHFGNDNQSGLAIIPRHLIGTGELREHVDIARRLAKCFWAIGVSEQEFGFEELVDVLRSPDQT